MKIEDVIGNSELPEWDDEELEVSLESARSNLVALRKRHPNRSGNIPDNPPSAQSMLAKAKQLHATKKSDSMTTISIESYVDELDLDPETRLLLENMSS
ncbi:hypothetical protein NJR55_06655 [Idiomarina sp. M1R2S28]|uniref:Uncharacterized protein n=1 Tax=Idiomarina rhizosphaerae TaxID=2961572 RepID=A0A9X2FVE4_9GAMM|nr:hypothetical protein [Idiomarina rhizosphaerae]MCP1339272.1 hypothetical protein [Idiomarina rhizosphaerae]